MLCMAAAVVVVDFFSLSIGPPPPLSWTSFWFLLVNFSLSSLLRRLTFIFVLMNKCVCLCSAYSNAILIYNTFNFHFQWILLLLIITESFFWSCNELGNSVSTLSAIWLKNLRFYSHFHYSFYFFFKLIFWNFHRKQLTRSWITLCNNKRRNLCDFFTNALLQLIANGVR